MKHPNPMTYKMKETIWHLWKAGDPMANISKVLSKPPATIFSYLQYHGGIRPRLRSRSLFWSNGTGHFYERQFSQS